MNPETPIMQRICLALTRWVVLFRNNVGQYQAKDGSHVRYGICNPGGSDLIGWKSIVVTQNMVGQRLAVFVAIEVKTPTGVTSDAQSHFIEQVVQAGGLAGVARSPEDAMDIIA